MARCSGTEGYDRLSHDRMRDLNRLRGTVDDVFASVGLDRRERIDSINDDLSDVGND